MKAESFNKIAQVLYDEVGLGEGISRNVIVSIEVPRGELEGIDRSLHEVFTPYVPFKHKPTVEVVTGKVKFTVTETKDVP